MKSTLLAILAPLLATSLSAADDRDQRRGRLDLQDLYAQNHPPGSRLQLEWDAAKDSSIPNAAYMEKFFRRTQQLWDDHQQDQIYFNDTMLRFHGMTDEVALTLATHFYNTRLDKKGRTQAVMNGKWLSKTQRSALVVLRLTGAGGIIELIAEIDEQKPSIFAVKRVDRT